MIGYTEEDARTDDFYSYQTLKSKLESLIEKWQREVDACGYYMEYDVKWKCIKELKEMVV